VTPNAQDQTPQPLPAASCSADRPRGRGCVDALVGNRVFTTKTTLCATCLSSASTFVDEPPDPTIVDPGKNLVDGDDAVPVAVSAALGGKGCTSSENCGQNGD
jgi:hypothetical protein